MKCRAAPIWLDANACACVTGVAASYSVQYTMYMVIPLRQMLAAFHPCADPLPQLVMQGQQDHIADRFQNRRNTAKRQGTGHGIHQAKGHTHVQDDLTGGFRCGDHTLTPYL